MPWSCMIFTMPSVVIPSRPPFFNPRAILEVMRSAKSSSLPRFTPSRGPIFFTTATAAAAILAISLSAIPTVSFSYGVKSFFSFAPAAIASLPTVSSKDNFSVSAFCFTSLPYVLLFINGAVFVLYVFSIILFCFASCVITYCSATLERMAFCEPVRPPSNPPVRADTPVAKDMLAKSTSSYPSMAFTLAISCAVTPAPAPMVSTAIPPTAAL